MQVGHKRQRLVMKGRREVHVDATAASVQGRKRKRAEVENLVYPAKLV
jgi:hypothetical protein